MDRIFLTGASGFIGRRFLEYLITKNECGEVVCPVRDTRNQKIKSRREVNFYLADLMDKKSIAKGLKGCEIVFHFAAKAGIRDRKILFGSNVLGTRNLVDVAIESGSVKKIIFLSSIWAVDRPLSDKCDYLLDESSQCIPSTAYGKTKFEGETIIKNSGLPYLILRLPPVYGPGSKNDSFVSRFIFGIKRSNPLYRVAFPGRVSLIFIDDLVKACYIAAFNPAINNQTFFVSDGKPVKIFEIAKEIINGLDLNGTPINLPQKIVDIIKRVNYSYILCKILPSEWKSLIMDYLVCDSSKFEKVSGFKPEVTLSEGILETVKWHNQIGWQ